jgi:IclR family KDG regulon transcriptional repressor
MDAITGSLERVVAILDLFAGMRFRGDLPAGQASLGVTDVSRQLHLPKGTVSRYLSRMEEVGILQRLPDRRYVLGNRVYDWGQAAAPGQDVRPWARPVMEMLAREHGETVSLMVRDGDEAVCIDQVDGLFPIRLSAVRGRRLSLYTGASPRLLLAFAPEDEREDYISRCNFIRVTSRTIADPEQLRSVLADIPGRGYAVSEGELDEGVVSFAAPIRNAAGRVVASMSAAGPKTRLEGARREALIAGLLAATAKASAAIGYRPCDSGATEKRRGPRASKAA